MVSPEKFPASAGDLISSPRISFSGDFLDDRDFISITPNSKKPENEKNQVRNPDFEFLSPNKTQETTMLTADELFFEGKLLPFWQKHLSEKLEKISIKTEDSKEEKTEEGEEEEEESRSNWFIDDDPSPRPPNCTVLWKELLKLKKQRASSLSPSASSSSSSSSSSIEEESNREKYMKRIKRGLQRTRSASFRIRPMVNVPCTTTQAKSNGLPPLFSARKGRVTER